jgi:hypothetical protein
LEISCFSTCKLNISLFKDTGYVKPLLLSRSDFEAIENWILSEVGETPGKLIRAVFKFTSVGGSIVEELNLKYTPLSLNKLYLEAKNTAKYWKSLTFMTPFMPEIEKSITCRIDRRGGLTLYTPDLKPLEIDILLRKLEKALIGV